MFPIPPNERVFLDTSFAIALAVATDHHHTHALQYAAILESQKNPILTTTAILFELGNSLSKWKYRAAAVSLINSLEADPQSKSSR